MARHHSRSEAHGRRQRHATPANGSDAHDLGFGSVVMQESRTRFLNRDGSFNVVRRGLGYISSLSLYHALLTMKWWEYVALVTTFYLLTNTIFAGTYMLCGHDALVGPSVTPGDNGFLRAFFFSVQTFATIGYGHISPSGLMANILVTIESLFGLLVFTVATGVVFARFSRPTARIIFSDRAMIMPYHGITAFGFRIANQRSNQLIEMEAKVMLSRFEEEHGNRMRRFHALPLERSKVAFFPLSWTVVHPIDDTSPLFELTPEQLRDSDAEILVMLSGYDETFSQTVHTRSSYKWNEIVWNGKFSSIFDEPTRQGLITIDVGRLHDYVIVEDPEREELIELAEDEVIEMMEDRSRPSGSGHRGG